MMRWGWVAGLVLLVGVLYTWRTILRDLRRESTLSWLRTTECANDKKCLDALDDRYDECFADEFGSGLFEMMGSIGFGGRSQVRRNLLMAHVKACVKS